MTAELDKQLNDLILSGKAMEAFDRFYADDVVMQENAAEPMIGKAPNRAREEQFFGSVEEFYANRLLSSAVDGDVSFSEWEWELKFRGSPRVTMNQVAVRRWSGGKVTHERFYYNKG